MISPELVSSTGTEAIRPVDTDTIPVDAASSAKVVAESVLPPKKRARTAAATTATCSSVSGSASSCYGSSSNWLKSGCGGSDGSSPRGGTSASSVSSSSSSAGSGRQQRQSRSQGAEAGAHFGNNIARGRAQSAATLASSGASSGSVASSSSGSNSNTASSLWIRYPHPNDILCGRGRGLVTHPGNVQFRTIVSHRKDEYILSSTQRDKNVIIRQVMEQVKRLDPPGRFLVRDNNSVQDPNDDVGYWIEVVESKAVSKTSQALREGAPNRRAGVRKILQAHQSFGEPLVAVSVSTSSTAMSSSSSSSCAAAGNKNKKTGNKRARTQHQRQCRSIDESTSDSASHRRHVANNSTTSTIALDVDTLTPMQALLLGSGPNVDPQASRAVAAALAQAQALPQALPQAGGLLSALAAAGSLPPGSAAAADLQDLHSLRLGLGARPDVTHAHNAQAQTQAAALFQAQSALGLSAVPPPLLPPSQDQHRSALLAQLILQQHQQRQQHQHQEH